MGQNALTSAGSTVGGSGRGGSLTRLSTRRRWYPDSRVPPSAKSSRFGPTSGAQQRVLKRRGPDADGSRRAPSWGSPSRTSSARMTPSVCLDLGGPADGRKNRSTGCPRFVPVRAWLPRHQHGRDCGAVGASSLRSRPDIRHRHQQDPPSGSPDPVVRVDDGAGVNLSQRPSPITVQQRMRADPGWSASVRLTLD
jgi:hypothetical protein